MFQLFVYAGGAQHVLSHGEASSASGRAFAGAAGLMIAVFATIGTSGKWNDFLIQIYQKEDETS